MQSGDLLALFIASAFALAIAADFVKPGDKLKRVAQPLRYILGAASVAFAVTAGVMASTTWIGDNVRAAAHSNHIATDVAVILMLGAILWAAAAMLPKSVVELESSVVLVGVLVLMPSTLPALPHGWVGGSAHTTWGWLTAIAQWVASGAYTR